MVKKEEFFYDSSDGKTSIHGVKWTPSGKEIKGVLQIAHGMLEYINRYDEFAYFIAENGFVVVGNDHLGHGDSVVSDNDRGFFCEHDGESKVLGDMYNLMNIVKSSHPDIPYFLLGHSMGSFFTRKFIISYGNELQGAIIVGTGYQPYVLVKTGQIISEIISAVKGERHRSKFVNYLALGKNNNKFEPSRTKNDWLTRDEKIVDAYNSDEKINFMFTINAYKCMFSCILYFYDNNHLNKMKKDLPILIISGEDDPVGDFGKGVTKVYNKFKEINMKNVTLKLYENARHEIINEINRDIVYNDVLGWLKEQNNILAQDCS
ncbi:MAG: alpha/beta hydrolase [Tissierellia bacterium]|nr:alpha/beta hydrolase [Tissierellia bacterium]